MRGSSGQPPEAQSAGESEPNSREQRWRAEAEFFDREAQQRLDQVEPTDPRTLERYRSPRRRRFNMEYRYLRLGDLSGRSVLDIGCGDGTNAVILAKLGAQVTGIDISGGAIELAKRRARADDVQDVTRFICSPLESVDFEPHTFDIVWGDAILHHVINDLDGVLSNAVRWAKPDGVVVFAEPVSLSPTLRRMRQRLPIETDATPDERPLEPAELDIVRRHLPGVEVRYFGVLGRLARFLLIDENYERSPWPRRVATDALLAFDYALLALPPVRRLASTCVLFGRAPGR